MHICIYLDMCVYLFIYLFNAIFKYISNDRNIIFIRKQLSGALVGNHTSDMCLEHWLAAFSKF